MATRYADRAFLVVAGIEMADIQSASIKRNDNARVVPSMTRDRKNKGFVSGNSDFDVTFTLAVQNGLASPKIENINFESNDVALVFECGADTYTMTGLFFKDTEQNAGGIGDEVKKTFNMGALDQVDAAGNSSLFNIQL